MSTNNISSTQKAALILIAMGVDCASEVMRNLSDKEVEKITVEIAKSKNVTSDHLAGVIEEYYALLSANKYITEGGIDYAKQVLENAWGAARAEDIIKRVEAATEISAFYLLQTVDDKQLLSFLQNEHPQTAALILANLKPKQSASILSELSEEDQNEITYRLATMEKTSQELIEDIEDVLRDQVGTVFGGDLSRAGGVESAANILNAVSRSAEKSILGYLRERDPELSNEITNLMFLFDDIIGLDDNAIQRIVKEVDSKTIALALKAAQNDLKEKIFKNMSERAAEMLQDELQFLGPVRVKEVENAQKVLLDVVRELEEAGEISILSGDKEEIIE